MFHLPFRLFVSATVCTSSLACGTATTITTHDGQEFQGTVVSADAESISLRTGPAAEPEPEPAPLPPGCTCAGEADRVERFPPTVLPRSQVADIDHPGNGLITGGAIVGFLGLTMAASERKSSPVGLDFGGPDTQTVGALMLGTGLAMGLVGALRYSASDDATKPAVEVGVGLGAAGVSGRF